MRLCACQMIGYFPNLVSDRPHPLFSLFFTYYNPKQELVDHLSVILTPYPVEVIRGGGVSDGYIEVRPAGASKGIIFYNKILFLLLSGWMRVLRLSEYLGYDDPLHFIFNFIFYFYRISSLFTGLFLEHCLSTMRSLGQDADFVMAIGDDSSDEPMFQVCEDIHICVLHDCLV